MQPTQPPQFDPALIERYAEQLYRKADSVRVGSVVFGAFLGILFGATPMTPFGKYLPVHPSFGMVLVLLGGLVGGFLGYVIGEGRAFRIRLQAQMVLFQLQIERNTHRLPQAPAAPAPVPARPAAPAPTAAPAAAPAPAPVVAAPAPPPAPAIPVQPARRPAAAVASAVAAAARPAAELALAPPAPQPVQPYVAPRQLQAVPEAEPELAPPLLPPLSP